MEVIGGSHRGLLLAFLLLREVYEVKLASRPSTDHGKVARELRSKSVIPAFIYMKDPVLGLSSWISSSIPCSPPTSTFLSVEGVRWMRDSSRR
ncbi:hypothetical protein M427DRAFT_57045 [Gonapodya prolifera JEL478]|uniref:Uncharacterized protein n=1 Tax=Gonapodya prolifera (strain JEL478) TaxID=1344416 RepID=A0A139AES9_GONPJ|nr:hypothetical protein M427DRAFT_57045 [Gonapodya prolifera JEL478]|eukprot:KXS15179.1 hypothetical protein M427DRAFT_57045 [Gonapodya prolifera JEL478]